MGFNSPNQRHFSDPRAARRWAMPICGRGLNRRSSRWRFPTFSSFMRWQGRGGGGGGRRGGDDRGGGSGDRVVDAKLMLFATFEIVDFKWNSVNPVRHKWFDIYSISSDLCSSAVGQKGRHFCSFRAGNWEKTREKIYTIFKIYGILFDLQ